MRNPTEVRLSPEQRETLEARTRSHTVAVRDKLRARIILRCAAGERNETIASSLGINRDTASKWRNRFAEHGLDGLNDAPRPGGPRSITDELEKAIVEATLTPPKARTHWSIRSMARHMGVATGTVRMVWKRHDLKPHLVRTFKLSKDPAFEEKVEDIVGLYLDPPENAIVLCVDEKSQIQALDRTRPILPIRPGLPEHQTHDYTRHGTTTLFAALNAHEGEVIHQLHDRHRTREFIQFLDHVDAETPADKDLHLVVDNLITHRTKEVKAWLEAHPRVALHFTPTSSSWLNLVERLFSKLQVERLQRGTFRSVDTLNEAIAEWVEAHNEDPLPFRWTAKTEDILRKVEKYRRIHDTLH